MAVWNGISQPQLLQLNALDMEMEDLGILNKIVLFH